MKLFTTNWSKFIVLIITFTLFNSKTVFAQTPTIINVTTGSPSNSTKGYAVYERFELFVELGNLPPTYNPCNYDDVVVSAVFTNVSAGVTTTVFVDGFYAADYTMLRNTSNLPNGDFAPTGTGRFRIRFAPTKAGTWTYSIKCTYVKPNTNSTYPPKSFICSDLGFLKGFIRKTDNNNYLSRDNREQFIPISQNLCWRESMSNMNLFACYPKWVNAFPGNHIRLWMADWSFGLEWKNQNGLYPYQFKGLRQYNQANAFYLDWLMDYIGQRSMSAMLCINHHGQLTDVAGMGSASWKDNPYNTANGGMCAQPNEFFSNLIAKATFKNQLRYIIARWGYAHNLSAWELFNEVDLTKNFSTNQAAIVAWHDEMSTYIKKTDPNKHLVTTSFLNEGSDAATWNLLNIDFTQTHRYDPNPNIEKVTSTIAKDKLAYRKPTLVGEFNLANDPTALIAADPTGIHVHNTVWATMLSGNLGSGMSWFWDTYIHPQNLYSIYNPLTYFAGTTAFKNDNYTPSKVFVSSSDGGNCIITPTPPVSWAAATAMDFTLSDGCLLTPNASNLNTYIQGMNTAQAALRKPPTFSVTYLTTGQFSFTLNTVYYNQLEPPIVDIYVDGQPAKVRVNNAATTVLRPVAKSGSTYTVDIPQGMHRIKVDNAGNDWYQVINYTFTNVCRTCQNLYSNAIANPTYISHGSVPPTNTFTLNSDGTLSSPAATSLARYIYGTKSGGVTKQPVKITATFLTAGQFILKIKSSAGGWAMSTVPTATINVLKQGTLGSGSTYPLVLGMYSSPKTHATPILSAGTYTITIDNVGDDWYEIDDVNGYTFTNVTSSVDVYALRSSNNNKMAAWVHNTKYTHVMPNPSAITCALVTIPGMTQGTYGVTWFDTYSYATSTVTVAVASDGNLKLTVPALSKDMAVKAEWLRSVRGAPVEVAALAIRKDTTLNKSEPSLQLLPNLAQAGEKLTLVTEGVEEGEWTLSVVNMLGQVIKSENQYIVSGKNQLSLTTEPTLRGQFMVVLSNEKQRLTSRFMLW